MKKAATDQQILNMLKQGKSYTDIQAELGVSPSRISIIKKKNIAEIGEALEAFLTDDPKKEEPKSEEAVEYSVRKRKLIKLTSAFKKQLEAEFLNSPPKSPKDIGRDTRGNRS